MGFAAEAYTQGERFQLEKRRLFAASWLPFCAADQLAAPGMFVNHTMGGWPMFAIRGADGVARGFRNKCRHQGMPVVEKPAGQCDALRCRYHGWTYDLAGALTFAPPLVAPEDLRAPIHHLDALALVETGGMIHVRGRGTGAPEVADIALGDRTYRDALSLDLDANWKTVIECLLADADRRFVWPIAFTGDLGDARIVRQVVPRSFSRTRLVDLVFAAPGIDPSAARDAVAADAQHVKTAAEALQHARAAGDNAPDLPAVDAFRERLATILDPR
jgi:nitrite reductase/ring-hydroxylating ferredoxin subunit